VSKTEAQRKAEIRCIKSRIVPTLAELRRKYHHALQADGHTVNLGVAYLAMLIRGLESACAEADKGLEDS